MPNTWVRVDFRPNCDICKAFQGINDIPALYDGATTRGAWAYMCESHFQAYGVGLGLGKGQRLIFPDDPTPTEDTN